MTITQEELKKLLHYDPETGVFRWLVDKGRSKKGSAAGCVESSRGKKKIRIRINGKKYMTSLLAYIYMTGEIFSDDNYYVMHIDGDTLDNRWCNLRKSNRNIQKTTSNKTGVIGVNFCKRSNKWRSEIRIDRKVKHIGYFNTIFDAACARKSAEIKYGLKA